ncbi:4Fe-4S dicluster domain-containing protein [Acetivibrio straminisolvens]|jgi:pyruvate ferredoxin oxidoreductase delta subunit|uniref:Pyruvate:ferredoxin oxidoreductase n=1 Tax=Acetivibrio straminisolvens JCM 21531 TaxID=1294263 RepID=W4V228_9FIRM|nr:4Fe-4S dicluster domain-containing protein [Acetivibrio straminisolvens]GAE86789.1 pyruvate:ferredoxin oxidoreductase [Acetivibrio straminisolvens JCM 21531]
MNRPKLREYVKPKHIKDYPVGPCYTAGHLVTENADWRTEKPVVESTKCTGCFYCYLCCPEGVIYKEGKAVDIDYAFCKGCGICARVCPKKAVKMIRKEKNHGR